MAIQAAAVEVLIQKARFEPEVALGIAEAIETSMMSAQFVTVPILDARLHELKAETRIALASLEYKVSAAIQELSAKVDHRYAELDAKIDRKWGELDAKMDRILGQLDGKIDRRYGELETAIERSKAGLVRWVFLAMLGNVALSAGATVVLNAFRHVG
jgi:transposase